MKYSLNYIIRTDRLNSEGTCPIYLRYTINRKFINLPIKISINPEYWDKDNSFIKKRIPNHSKLKNLLNEYELKVREKIDEYFDRNNQFPLTNNLKYILQNTSETSNPILPIKRIHSLEGLFKEYKEHNKNEKFSKSTIDIYNYTWDKWSLFESNKKKQFTYEEMNYNTITEFKIFLLNKGLQKNTIAKYIKTIKSFLSYLMLHKELPVPISYKKVEVEKEEPEFEVFTLDELEILKRECFFSRAYAEEKKEYNLTERESLIGKIMVFLCHTGLSFVDFDNLRIQHLHFINDSKEGKKLFINIIRQKLKTRTTCKIPILDVTIDIISESLGIPHQIVEANKKDPTSIHLKISLLKTFLENQMKKQTLNHNSRIFPKISSGKFNIEIKDVLKKIGIDEYVNVVKFKNGKSIQESVPKYSLISSHTGRRTYITRSLEMGIPPYILKDTTGHRKLQTLDRYNKNSNDSIHNTFKSKVLYQSGNDIASDII